MSVVIRVENLSKQYRLGAIGSGSLKDDIKRWRYRMMGREDPFLQIGDVNNRTKKGNSDYVWALRDINFDINQGEVVGLIGRNGAGKSTLLKILSRTTSPTTGVIKIKGRVASLLEVGTGFHSELSGRENIFLNGAILGMSKQEIKAKFDEIVDFSGVERYIETPVKRYSSGMYVRLAFAVAAHLDPEILIIDEVLAVGDAEFQKKALGKMKHISSSEGKTVLFVSHNLSSLSRLCNKGVILEHGNFKFSGNIFDALQKYSQFETPDSIYTFDGQSDADVFFRKIQLVTSDNFAKGTFFHDEEIVIRFDLQLDRNVEDYSIFVMILDRTKSRVFPAEKKITKGKSTYYLHIQPNFLVRGLYSIHTFIHIPKIKQIDVAEDVCSFEIIDNKSDLSIHNNYDYGNVFGNCIWK